MKEFLSKDMRLTSQRKIILEELRAVHTHPTADEVYNLVRKKMPRISLGTVYRNLEVLSTLGLVRKLENTTRQKRSVMKFTIIARAPKSSKTRLRRH